MRLKCVRINCSTDERKLEYHNAVVRTHGTLGPCLHLEPGVTGYESFVLADFFRPGNDTRKAWHACAGTKGSWDTLIVPADEMIRLVDILELIPH